MPTAVPPPGTGTMDAIVTTPTLAASSAQNDTCPPNAIRQSCRHHVDMIVADHVAADRGARAARASAATSAIVCVARDSGGTTLARSTWKRGERARWRGPSAPRPRAGAAAGRSSGSATGRPARARRAARPRSSRTRRRAPPKPLSTPPAATAEGRSTPSFCRKRTCMPWPPIAGIARFENDIATWSSVVGPSGNRVRTVPCNAIAYATLAANATTIASSEPAPVGAAHRVHDVDRITDVDEAARPPRRTRRAPWPRPSA